MVTRRLGAWLRVLRGTATFVFIAALCFAVALLVIGFIPKSPVTLALPTSALSGLHGISGVEPGVVVDRSGSVVFSILDPSLGQRMLYAATVVPALLLIAEIARRMANLLRAAQDTDPFTEHTARQLTLVAKITAFGGLGVWLVACVASWVLSATMLTSGNPVQPQSAPLGWLAVALIVAGFAQLIARGVDMRTELDTVI